MAEARAVIPNELGLHARAAARLVECANGFESDVRLEYRDRSVNGKSIMGVLMLAAARGAELLVITDGPDENEALDGVIGLIENGFGELA